MNCIHDKHVSDSQERNVLITGEQFNGQFRHRLFVLLHRHSTGYKKTITL